MATTFEARNNKTGEVRMCVMDKGRITVGNCKNSVAVKWFVQRWTKTEEAA